MTTVKLWFLGESKLARHYSKTNPKDPARDVVEVWVPKSLIEHTTKYPDGMHLVKLPDFFVDREGL